MSTPLLEDWPRIYHTGDGASPFLYYVVFGGRIDDLELSRSKYRCDSIPPEIELSTYGPEVHPEVLDEFRRGYLWNKLLNDEPSLAKTVAAQTSCVLIRGSVSDASTLNYLRNTIGLLMCLLDSGGVAIFDAQSFRWWSPAEWKATVFEPAAALPREHVVILVSDEEHRTQWLHTRGMRKFGRPDLSIRGVSPDLFEEVVELLNRFIEFQAFGGAIMERQEVRVHSLPAGMYCVHGGSEDDPDFNNSHVEIRWPADA